MYINETVQKHSTNSTKHSTNSTKRQYKQSISQYKRSSCIPVGHGGFSWKLGRSFFCYEGKWNSARCRWRCSVLTVMCVCVCVLHTGADGDTLLTLCLLERNSSDTWRAGHVTSVKAGVSVWVVAKYVIPASNRNEYHEYFLGAKGGRCVRHTKFLCRLSLNPVASTFRNPQGLSRPVQGLLCLYLLFYFRCRTAG